MNSPFNINNDRPFNYSGYGAIDLGFEGFDDTEIKKKNSEEEVYNEILDTLEIDKSAMLILINSLLKTNNMNYSFVRITNDFQTLFFEDENGHLTAITLQKIIEAKNQPQIPQYSPWKL